MEYKLFTTINRPEVLPNKITVYLHKYRASTGDTITGKIDLDAGKAVSAQYIVNVLYEFNKQLATEDFFALDNALRAIIVMQGEKCLEENIIAKFLKENTGIAIKNLKITEANKTYISTYRVGKYYSDEINLLAPTTTKNV